jgi:hypothetical protein
MARRLAQSSLRRKAQNSVEVASAWLAPEAREELGQPLAAALSDDGLDEAVVALRAFALVDREVIAYEHDASITATTIRLHRLVREIAAAQCKGESHDPNVECAHRSAGCCLSGGRL